MAMMGADNLIKLESLDIPSILDVIRARYQKKEIYTKCGEIIIAVNPFHDLGLYSDYHHELYKHEYWSKTLKPHIFYTAECALQNMLDSHTNQAIIVSGESGSGKTESTKFMLRHLMYSSVGNKDSLLQRKIIQVNPLLEAFGNAQTAMNRNSSRFGKYTEVCFNNAGRVTGAIIRDYMLEKSRLVFQNVGEGNFHVFYAFFAGANLLEYELQNLSNYRILRNTDIKLIKDIHRFKSLYTQIIGIFKTLNFTDEDINTVERILSSVIHLTQIEFVRNQSSGIAIKSNFPLSTVARLLNIDQEQLEKALLIRILKMPDESVETPKSIKQADEGRDALAKSLYERLFGWIVRKINEGIMPTKTEGCTIGILDISGFENLKKNNFEQLCINIINERLQNYLNIHIFECEKQIYLTEGVDLDAGGIDYQDNRGIIEMLIKPPFCLLSIINEESILQERNYKSLAEKMNSSFGKYNYYKASEGANGDFAIQHFAGEVWYNTYSFLEKNRDELGQDLMDCLQDSSDDFISDLFTVKKGPTGTISVTQFQFRPSRKITLGNNLQPGNRSNRRVGKRNPTAPDKTVISYLQASLQSLLQKLDESEPHFVRCIKPNDLHRPDVFNEEKVKEQLIYSGVAEAAKIRKLGFPYRLTFREFINRFSALTKFMKAPKEEKIRVQAMLQYLSVNPREYRLGTYKVFIKHSSYLYIGKCLKICKTLSAIRIQRIWKMYKLREQRRLEEIELQQKLTEEPKFKDVQSSVRRRTRKSVRIKEISPSCISHDAIPLENITLPLGMVLTHEHGEEKKTKKKKKKKEPPPPQNVTPSDDNANNEDDDDDDDLQAPWDIFETVEDEPDTSTLQNTTWLQLIKILFYIFISTIVLGTTVTQKLAFFALLHQHKNEAQNGTNPFSTLLLIAVCIPYGLTVLISLGKVLFGSKKTVSFKTALKVLMIETVHTVCLSLLVFDVLDEIGVVPGILLMNSTAFFPSLLRTAFPVKETSENSTNENNHRKSGIWKRTIIKFLDVISTITQLSSIIIIVIFLEELKWYTKLECVISFLFVSIYYWENFFDGCNALPKLNRALMEIKYELEHVRHFMNVITYTWKILLTVLIAFLLGNETFSVNFSNKSIVDDIHPFLPTILLCLCTAFGYYFAYLACKLCMQELAFSTPLLMSTPVAIAIAILPCWEKFQLDDKNPFKFLNECWWKNNETNIIYVAIGGLLYISIYWIVRHVFRSEQSRLMRRELLFLNPYFCSVFYEQGILMSRRRHNLIIQYSNVGGKSLYKLEKSKDSSSDQENTEGQKGKKYYPKVYACATMWHETPNEMMQILKSIFRMSIEQQVRKDLKELENEDDGYFEFEAHIFFDDCMTLDDNEEVVTNKFVQTFVTKVDEAASSVMKMPVKLEPPAKIITPYGGQLLWVLQSDVLLYVHLKDKKKIRHKKRWSQVMYMYYLLGHRLTKMCKDDLLSKTMKHPDMQGKHDIFELLNDDVNKTAENTFLLALDGDVDFNPDAVKLLIDLMVKNNKVGAACGRIHPIGSGPIVWFQIFEYAVGHWLQKATEHVLGCVLCSPGCFSLFRGSALMDTNVMRKYTILPTEPKHYLQYDQGEDRWLCTLLLQQGYRVDYCAAADAYTYAPDTFSEFFNQRRRWMPSTIANIMDLLASYKITVRRNNNISTLYILYQLALMVSTMIGPATVMMMIAAALNSVFSLDIPISYILVLIPNALYTVLCFYASTKTQINVACLLTAIYSFIMMAVLVGVVLQAVRTSVFNPGVIIITIMVILFVFTAILHPQEKSCLLPGLLYFLCIPSGYLLLVIYSLCNMHVVSWGTREVKAKLTKKQIKEQQELEEKKKSQSFWSKIFQFSSNIELFKASQMKKDNELLKALEVINDNIGKLLSLKDIEASKISLNSPTQSTVVDAQKKDAENEEDTDEDDEVLANKNEKADSSIPVWANGLGKGIIVDLNDEEKDFWHGVIKKYLQPLDRDVEEEKRAKENLMLFRTNMCFAMIMINLLWMAINFMFQDTKPSEIYIDTVKVELFSFVFLLFFTAIFTIQFLGMIMHRWGTFSHIISYTNIGNPFRKKKQEEKNLNMECCREIIRRLRYEPVPDYDIEVSEEQLKFEERVEEHIRRTGKTMHEGNDIEQNIAEKNIGKVLRKSVKRENTTIGLTIHRKVGVQNGRLPEPRYERKEQPTIIGSRRREQRRNLQLVSRKNLKKDIHQRLLQQSRREHAAHVIQTDIID